MAAFLRRLFRNFFIIVNLFVAVAFLLACCNAWLSPGRYWYIAILGVGFPFLLLALLIFMIGWWMAKSRKAFISLAVILAGLPQLHALFGFHPFSSFDNAKPAGAIRVMQWNVARLDQMNAQRPGGSYRKQILDFIAAKDPDVVCLEEFLESNNPREFARNIPYFTDTLHYPYHYFADDHRRWDGLYASGVIIFSKYPFLDTLRLRYGGADTLRDAESLIHADIAVNGKRLRIFATHLQSLRFDGNDLSAINTIKKGDETGAVGKSKGILRKFQLAYVLRSKQAELVHREISESPYPTVLCGDFNDVPNSFTYFKIKGDGKDAHIASGFGLGRSFAAISPTLRIDYILTGDQFSILQFKTTRLPYSDHYPVVADVQLR